MSRLVIFDLDGTLIDSRLDIAASANAARAHVGLTPLPTELIASYVGDGARNLVIRALGPEHQHLLEPAVAEFFRYYGEHLVVRTEPYAGIRELLGALTGTLTVLTNKPGDLARPICERLELASFFPLVWGEGDVPARKPDPRGALELCRRFGVAPQEARFVGDSKADAATAKNAGIPFIGVTWGFGSEAEMRGAGATQFVDDAGALHLALERA